MSPRRYSKSQNGEIPLGDNGPDMTVPEQRIEMGNAPEIDITDDRVGSLFTERRRALGLRIEEIAEDIKVKAEYLRAIEREDFDSLPTPQYARLFVRAYAERLGFNVSEVYALLDINVPNLGAVATAKAATVPGAKESKLTGPLPGTQATYPDSPKKQSKTAMLWWGIGLTIVILTVVGWIALKWEEQPIEATSDTQVRPAPVETTAPAVADEGALVPDDITPVEAAVPSHFELELHFDRETWASLYADDTLVQSRIFTSGEILTASAQSYFRLSLGHTVGVTVTSHGKMLRPFLDWANRLEAHLITRDSIEKWIDTSAVADMAPMEPSVDPATPGQDSAGAP